MKRRQSRYQEKHPRILREIHAITERQAEYLHALHEHPQVVVMGPAGTGKTYIAAATAANELLDRKIEKIILTRPNVPAGRSLGFLPGSMAEKIGPWVVPFTDVIEKYMGKGAYETAFKNKQIDIVPFEVMRGRTFDNAFIILDEAQNTLPSEMKMFLTRIGEESTVVINGDVKQSDLKADSGLTLILDMIRRQRLPVPVVEFTIDDIVRSDLCAMWIKAFDKEGI